LQHHHFI